MSLVLGCIAGDHTGATDLASMLVRQGMRTVQRVGVQALRIGPPIDPGVPWCEALGTPHLALALKSGNFGAADFLTKAFAMLP